MNEWRTAYQRYIGAIYRVNVFVAGSVPTPVGISRLVHFRAHGSLATPGAAGVAYARSPCATTSTTRSPAGRCCAICAPGKRDRLDVCDAQPELAPGGAATSASRSTATARSAGPTSLVLVSYVYGDGLRRANGRCIETAEELAELEATHEEFSRYVVEVCLDCRWNHLQRHELHGRRHAG